MDKPTWTNWNDKKAGDLMNALADISAQYQAEAAAFQAQIDHVNDDLSITIPFSFVPENYKP